MLKELMQTTNFRVTVVEESDVVEICGALKVRLCLPLRVTNNQLRAFNIHPGTSID